MSREMRSLLIWPIKTAASFTRQRSMTKGWVFALELNLVGVFAGLRQARP